jgi:hypothetical protein
MCKGGHLEVEFRPGEELSVPGLGQHRSRRPPSNAGRLSASQSQTRSFVATHQLAQTWPSRPSRRRDSPASPTVLLWSRPTRSGCRTPSPVAASVAAALQTGIANVERAGGSPRGWCFWTSTSPRTTIASGKATFPARVRPLERLAGEPRAAGPRRPGVRSGRLGGGRDDGHAVDAEGLGNLLVRDIEPYRVRR